MFAVISKAKKQEQKTLNFPVLRYSDRSMIWTLSWEEIEMRRLEDNTLNYMFSNPGGPRQSERVVFFGVFELVVTSHSQIYALKHKKNIIYFSICPF